MSRLPRQLTVRTLLRATDELSRRDPMLGDIVDRYGPPPLWARRPGFATLLRIILEQQVSLSSARSMFDRLHRHAGGVTPESIESLGVRGLRALGFTRQKADYCAGLASAIRSGRLDLRAVSRMPDDEGMAALQGMRGLGPWSVDIYYLMALRRPDIWPRGDLALATTMQRMKQMRDRPDHATLARVAAGWAPWRSVAARILWHHYLGFRQAEILPSSTPRS